MARGQHLRITDEKKEEADVLLRQVLLTKTIKEGTASIQCWTMEKVFSHYVALPYHQIASAGTDPLLHF